MRALAGLVLVLLPAFILAQGSNTIRSETKVVLVDAVVSGKKGYVRDLAAKDFEIFEDGKKQAITSFSSESDAGSSRTHYMILLFDDSSMDSTDQRRARAAAAQFVASDARPGQMLAIATFRGTLEIAQNFTDDPARLQKVLSGGESAAFAVNGTAPGLAGAANLGARNLYLAVRALARDLASAPGRKTLVLLSAESQLKPEEQSAEINAALEACNRANVAVYGVDTRGFSASPTGFGGRVNAGEPPSRMRIGPLDCTPDSDTIGCQQTSAEMSGPLDSSRTQQALWMLSTGSGGFMTRGTNDLTAALAKIGDEQDQYYLLGYTPPDSPEGSCHKLRVKVDRGRTSVRARAGYCNARSNNPLAGSSIEKELETLPAAEPGGANATLAAPFFYSGDLARVNVAMEIPLNKLKTEKHNGKLSGSLHVLGIAHRSDGSVAARFSESVALDFDDEKRLVAFLATPFHYENEFEIVPGAYTLEVAYDAGEVKGKVQTPLVVDPYQPQFALSGLVLSRQYGPASDPRLRTAAIWTADRTPLIAEGMRLVPSGSNRFKKTEAPALYAEVYQPPDAKATIGITMRIVDRKTGEEKLATGVLPISIPQNAVSPAIPFEKRIPIDTLPPGSYRLELDAADNAGKTAHRTADFEIE